MEMYRSEPGVDLTGKSELTPKGAKGESLSLLVQVLVAIITGISMRVVSLLRSV